jgi:hypothetical protein
MWIPEEMLYSKMGENDPEADVYSKLEILKNESVK